MISAGEIAKQETFTQASHRSLGVGESDANKSLIRAFLNFVHGDIVSLGESAFYFASATQICNSFNKVDSRLFTTMVFHSSFVCFVHPLHRFC